MNSKTHDYKYGLISPFQAIWMVVVTSILLSACINLATRDSPRLQVLGGIQLPSLFMWFLVVLSAWVVFYTLTLAFSSIRAPKFVRLEASQAVVPNASILGGALAIPYEKINTIEVRNQNSSNKIIFIGSPIGKAKLLASHFNGRSDFESFLSTLRARAGNHKAAPPTASLVRPETTALMKAVEERQNTDPFFGPKLGAKEINLRLLNAMKNENSVHFESVLCALGALAGYACQANLRAQALIKGAPENTAFTVVETADGHKYFFGDPLNKVLAETEFSVWCLVAGAAQHNGCNQLPDISSIFNHVSATVGDASFGVPRLPEGHHPEDKPINYVKDLWPNFLPIVKQSCHKSSEWPILYALAIQEIFDLSKNTITPELALKIVMESAIPMSKIDLTTA